MVEDTLPCDLFEGKCSYLLGGSWGHRGVGRRIASPWVDERFVAVVGRGEMGRTGSEGSSLCEDLLSVGAEHDGSRPRSCSENRVDRNEMKPTPAEVVPSERG